MRPTKKQEHMFHTEGKKQAIKTVFAVIRVTDLSTPVKRRRLLDRIKKQYQPSTRNSL